MKFSVTQSFDRSRDEVVELFRSEATWQAFAGLPFVGDPRVVGFEAADPTEVLTAYKVSIDLPALADRFIDADKLTFVEVTRLAADGSGTFEIVPDHYKKMLRSSGTTAVRSVDGQRCERVTSGIVDVNLGWSGKLFESPVEDAIVNGLKRALLAQAAQLH